jgi:glutathione peroxidase
MKKILVSILTATAMMTHAQQSIHEFSFKAIDGTEKSFADYKGKKILIVNVASECGYTPQYAGLQDLHEMRWEKLAIVAFPANNFGGQEPGDDKDIASFCAKNFGVTFQMAAKVSVKGRDIDPLFEWLNAQENPDFTGDIKWNFEKYLLDENGILIHRYRSAVEPDDEALLKAIG